MTTPTPVPLTTTATVWTDPYGTVAQLVLYTGLIVALLLLVAFWARAAVTPDDDGSDRD